MTTQAQDGLKDVVSPERAALIVVDDQNDFCHEEGKTGATGADMTAIQLAAERTDALIADAHRFGVPVVFIRTTHDRWNNSPVWSKRPSGRGQDEDANDCVTGTWGAEFYKVSPGPNDAVVTKHRYSAFIGTDLEMTLRTLRRDSMLVTGTVTNVCVESTCREAFMREFNVVLVDDCSGATDRAAHDATLHNISHYFGWVADSQQIVGLWSGEAGA